MEASSIFLTRLVHLIKWANSKVSMLTVASSKIVMPSMQHEMMITKSFMADGRNDMTESSPDVHSFEQDSFHIYLTRDFTCYYRYCMPRTGQIRPSQHTGHCGIISNPCNLHLYSVRFVLS